MKFLSIAAFLVCVFQSNLAVCEEITLRSWSIPAAGNGFPKSARGNMSPTNHDALTQLSNAEQVLSLYFHLDRPATIGLDIEAKAGETPIALRVKINNEEHKIAVRGDAVERYRVGSFDIENAGYVRVDLQREVSDDPETSVKVKGFVIDSPTEDLQITCVATDEGSMYYWGRRGPSVHLSYQVPRDVAIEYAYSEITVDEGEDPIGSYFMANGFAEGYFGIQVNSPTERRVLFSVWSPFQTDDPRKIPQDQRVELLAKGSEVRTGEFGNEGSGGQSYLVYPWRAGQTYRFLTNVLPDGKGSTIYTSWFGDKQSDTWRLIASFRRPKTNTYLRGFHSFLENFDPSTGDQMRRGQHGNIWVRDKDGTWHECLKARFSVDATGQGKHRLDFDGGSSDSIFYLKNCGFFAGTKKPGAAFERKSTSSAPPVVDLQDLPVE
jgi:hypothetical protein